MSSSGFERQGVTVARISWYPINEATDVGRRTIEVPIGATATIGRDPGNDIVLEDQRVSRRHARLEIKTSGIILEDDLHVTNASLIDGRRRLGRTPWRVGQKLQIGRYLLEVALVRAASTTASDQTVEAVETATSALPESTRETVHDLSDSVTAASNETPTPVVSPPEGVNPNGDKTPVGEPPNRQPIVCTPKSPDAPATAVPSPAGEAPEGDTSPLAAAIPRGNEAPPSSSGPPDLRPATKPPVESLEAAAAIISPPHGEMPRVEALRLSGQASPNPNGHGIQVAECEQPDQGQLIDPVEPLATAEVTPSPDGEPAKVESSRPVAAVADGSKVAVAENADALVAHARRPLRLFMAAASLFLCISGAIYWWDKIKLPYFGADSKQTLSKDDRASIISARARDCASDDPDQRLAACSEIIDKAGDDKEAVANAYRRRGLAYLKKQLYDRAIADYTEALRLDPSNTDAYSSRASAYEAKRDLERAIADYTEAIRLNPTDSNAYNNRAGTYRTKGDFDLAIGDYTEAIRLNPSFASAYNNRGLTYRAKGDFDHAIADHTQATRLNPSDASAYNYRGICHRAKGDFDQAIADYTQAIRLDPSNAQVHNNRGIVHAAKGDFDRAIADHTEAIRLNPSNANAYSNRGLALLSKREFDRAIADHSEAIRLDPKNSIAYSNRATVYDAKREFDLSIADYTEAIRLNPTDSNVYNNRAGTYRAKGNLDLAMADHTEAIRLNLSNANAYNNRGVTYRAKGDFDRAIADHTEAIRLNRSYANSYNYRGIAYAAKGDFDRAIEDYTESIRLNPSNSNVYNSRGYAYRAKSNFDRAIADHTEAIRLNPSSASAYNSRGNAYRGKGDHDRAISDHTEAIRIDPTHVDAYNSRGIAHRAKGEYDQAILDYTTAIGISPKLPVLYNNRGRAYEFKGDKDLALADYRKVLELPATTVSAQQRHEIARQRIERLSRGERADTTVQRVALVIGNSNYVHAGLLTNPKNDAQAMAATLRRLGFAEVIERYDLTREKMGQALKEFGDRAEGAEWAIIYFAGHGLEMNGTTYLIPTDAALKRDAHVADEALSLTQVQAKADVATKLGLVILDSCRNNPFLQRMARSAGAARSIGSGLANIEPEGNVLVAYSAKHGTTALDGSGEHSPFTEALLTFMEEPGLELNFLFRKVRDEVRKKTDRRQEPFLYGSLSSELLYFRGGPAAAATVKPSAQAATVERTAEQWMDRWIADKRTRSPVGALQFTRFKDPIYVLTSPIGWKPNAEQAARYKPVEVPKGFVTDLASIPQLFWSALRPDGEYAYAAIIHDYLYWTQETSKEMADEIFQNAMIDFKIDSRVAATIYNAVRFGGASAWQKNAELKAKGEKRILKMSPDDPRITWSEWKAKPEVFE